MVGAERRGRSAASLLVALLPAALGFGCAARVPDATALPPVSEVPIATEEPLGGGSPVAAPKPPAVVVIDEGGLPPDQVPRTLAEAAKEEKERRARAEKPVVALDNKSLAAHGKDQKLTVAEGVSTPAAGAASTDPELDEAAVRDESYWRNRGLQIRQQWRAAADRVGELQGEAEDLRRRFYAADDPYIRDNQIKPEWDRVLDDLDSTRREAERSAEELERFLDAGRRGGALPGWLREGVELEPEERPLKRPSAEPGEPVEATDPASDPE